MDYQNSATTPAVGIAGIVGIAHNPNAKQPQGVTLNLDMSQVPDTGYFALEGVEEGQTTLPNIINLMGSATDAVLVINDGLLRTHQDAVYINVEAGTAVLYVLKKPIQQASELDSTTVHVMFEITEAGQYVLQRLNGEYVLSFGKTIKAQQP